MRYNIAIFINKVYKGFSEHWDERQVDILLDAYKHMGATVKKDAYKFTTECYVFIEDEQADA